MTYLQLPVLSGTGWTLRLRSARCRCCNFLASIPPGKNLKNNYKKKLSPCSAKRWIICNKSRQREGDKLATLVLDRLAQVESEVKATRAVLPLLIQQQRDRITNRIADLQVEVDQGRLEQELVYMAQRADVDEELDRLDAHIGEVRRTLKKGGACGRQLDFLMQELNREANTLSSKSQSATTTQGAVGLKVLIEQMREQIQNIE